MLARIFLVLLIISAGDGLCQTAVDLRTQSKSVDFSKSALTKPATVGTILPGTCQVGQIFFNSSASPGSNLFGCTATNIWSVIGAPGTGNNTGNSGSTVIPAWQVSGLAASATTDTTSPANILYKQPYANSLAITQQTKNMQTYNLTEKGAVCDGVADDSAAFAKVKADIIAHQFANPGGLVATPILVNLPAGVCTITAPGAFWDASITNTVTGPIYRGQGDGSTIINYVPTSVGPMIYNNDSLTGTVFENITFHGGNANSLLSDLMYSNGVSNSGQISWVGCTFSGQWAHLWNLVGSNLNSEWRWDRIGIYIDNPNFTAFYVNTTGTSDQFLNYWFHNSRIWIYEGNFIDMGKGGSVLIDGCDFSGWRNGTMFSLRGVSHAYGIKNLTVIHARGELQGTAAAPTFTKARVLYSEWVGGVHFIDCDFGSQSSFVTSPFPSFSFVEGGTEGASILDNVVIPGQVAITALNGSAYYHSKSIECNHCYFPNYEDWSQAWSFALDNPAGSNYGGFPAVQCKDCRGTGTALYALTNYWTPGTVYTAGALVNSNGYTYKCVTGGTAANPGPNGRGTAVVDGGGVKWTTVDSYISVQYADYGLIRPNLAPYYLPVSGNVTTPYVAFISNLGANNYLPSRLSTTVSSYGRVILPLGAIITKVTVRLPPGGTGQTSPATFVVRTDEFTPTTMLTATYTNPALGGVQSADPNLFTQSTDFGRRIILCEAQTSVTMSMPGVCEVTYQ